MNLNGKKIVILGDSITQGVGASSDETNYVSVFQKITGADVKNFGISGTRIAPQHTFSPDRSYDPYDYLTRVDKLDNDADIVVVFGGTNDYGHGDAPFGTTLDNTPDTFCGAVSTLMRNLINKYPDKIIVFMTPLHRLREEPHLPNNLPLKSYVDKIREIAEKYAIPVLDLYSSSGICSVVQKQMEYWLKDGLHPNDNGHKKIAYLLKAFLENLM